jgi:hypothetical protein
MFTCQKITWNERNENIFVMLEVEKGRKREKKQFELRLIENYMIDECLDEVSKEK